MTNLDIFNAKWTLDPNTGCHIWHGATGNKGTRAHFNIGGKKYLAYRWIMLETVGPDSSSERIEVAHAPGVCHNGLCVNTAHLRWATRAENDADKEIDGTRAYNHGEQSGMSKLTDVQVREIRAAIGTNTEIGNRYGIHNSQVSRIKNRRTWAHVQDL